LLLRRELTKLQDAHRFTEEFVLTETLKTHPLAVALCVLTMFCWGSWGNAQKLAASRPYRLYYWDFVTGMVLFAAIIGLSAGGCGGESAWDFVTNPKQASGANVGSAKSASPDANFIDAGRPHIL